MGRPVSFTASGSENNIMSEPEGPIVTGGLKKAGTGSRAATPSFNATMGAATTSQNRPTLAQKRSASAIPQRPAQGPGRDSLGRQQPGPASVAVLASGACRSGAFECAGSVFDPESFMGLLRDGPAASPVRVANERDLSKEVARIALGLGNAEDWQARIEALQLLQGLALGNLAEFVCSGSVVKSLMESVSAPCALFCSCSSYSYL